MVKSKRDKKSAKRKIKSTHTHKKGNLGLFSIDYPFILSLLNICVLLIFVSLTDRISDVSRIYTICVLSDHSYHLLLFRVRYHFFLLNLFHWVM